MLSLRQLLGSYGIILHDYIKQRVCRSFIRLDTSWCSFEFTRQYASTFMMIPILYICLFTLYLHWYIGKIKNLIRFNRPLYEITFIQLTLMITCNSRIKKNMICPKKGYIWLKMIMKSMKFNSLIPLIKTYCTCRFNCSWVDWRLA